MTMKLQLHGAAGKDLQVSEAAFGRDFNEGLIHQVVTAYMAGGRAGSLELVRQSRGDAVWIIISLPLAALLTSWLLTPLSFLLHPFMFRGG